MKKQNIKLMSKMLIMVALAIIYLAFALDVQILAGIGVVLIGLTVISDRGVRRAFNV